MRQSPWLAAARVPMLVAMLPAAVCVLATLYLAGWALTVSFTNLELTGPRSLEWNWIGLDNYVRLFTREGFLNSLWVTLVFTFFSAIVGQSVFGFGLAVTLRGARSALRGLRARSAAGRACLRRAASDTKTRPRADLWSPTITCLASWTHWT